MSDLLDFAGALTGLYEGPIAFDLNGEPFHASDAQAITANEGALYIQAQQPDGTVPFVWGIQDEASPSDWNGCRLTPTAVLHKDGVLILFWAFDTPMPAEAATWIETAFDMSLTEPVPTPGANGWELVRLDAETFYTYEDFERAYGDPAPSDGAIYAAVSQADADKAQAEIEALAAEVQAEPKPKKKAAAKKKADVKVKTPAVAEAPPWDEEPAKYGDAAVRAPYDETNPALQQDIVVTVGANAETYNWKPQTLKLGAMMAMLCSHKEGKKDGLAWVLGDMVAGKRGINSVKTLTAVGLDIDTGMSGKDLDKALQKLGLMAVRYTTHSHMKARTKVRKDIILNWIDKNYPGLEIEDPATVQKYLIEAKKYEPQVVEGAQIVDYDHSDRGIEAVIDHMPMAKHRIVLPLAVPYDIAKESKGTSQKAALEKWRLIPKALARDLGDLPIDKTGSDPNRLFYLPRHDKNAPFEISLFGGDLLDWTTMRLVDEGEELEKFLNQGKSKSTTAEGRELGRWSLKRAHGFQVADVIRTFAPERIRSDTGLKIEIECPFDENHSNPGDPDDRACMAVNAGDGPSEIFTVSCRHESCQDRTNLDMVGKMVADGWFDREDIDKEDFNAILDEDDAQPATPEQTKRIETAARIEAEDEARAEYQVKADAITKTSSAAEIEDCLKTILEANLSSIDEARAVEAVQKKVGLSSPRFKSELNRIKRELTSSKNKSKDGKRVQLDDGKRVMFTYSGEIDFHAATDACFDILKTKNEQEGVPHFACLEQRPVRLTHSKLGRSAYNEISSRTLWSELNKYITFVRSTDDGSIGARASVPKEVGDQVYETMYEELPPAPEIIYTPIYDSKGRLISEPGYYEDENLLIPSLDFEVPEVPAKPTQDEVDEAVRLLVDELLIDFPFSDYDSNGVERSEPSRANAMAMILTPFMRRMINGCTPVFFVSKPVPGTGGTYLGKIPILLFDGEEGAPMIYTENPDEMAKALLAGALAAKSHMFFDDVKSFNNREIMRAITSTQVGGRVLGASRNIEVANRFNWVATGNNPDIKPEMGRRVVTIRLNLKEEEINTRVFKGHPDLHGWLKENRSQIIGAILTLIQHWMVNTAKKPFKTRKLASFEDWAEKVGGVLEAAGIDGFLDNRKAAETDIDEAATRALVRDWFKKYADKAVTPNDLFNLADDTASDLIDGNTEDKRTRNKFFKHLNHIENRLFNLGNVKVVVIRTIDQDKSPHFMLQVQD
ncbi:PE-PGRS family protein [Caulobacter phage C1]|nr:PE-PGRS family protein [Caulobacter phage C1]UTU08441.1 PE-PGRS family protein [Caulobacter phage C2]UTU08958.1 PE-PGRS family protein [Caulobacter phage J4]UTU10074.1 PE-PGRS family protein [Caulobacter phage RB23]WGN97109.1 PE-PGRS famil protein [Bertelyvirus sp.]